MQPQLTPARAGCPTWTSSTSRCASLRKNFTGINDTAGFNCVICGIYVVVCAAPGMLYPAVHRTRRGRCCSVSPGNSCCVRRISLFLDDAAAFAAERKPCNAWSLLLLNSCCTIMFSLEPDAINGCPESCIRRLICFRTMLRLSRPDASHVTCGVCCD